MTWENGQQRRTPPPPPLHLADCFYRQYRSCPLFFVYLYSNRSSIPNPPYRPLPHPTAHLRQCPVCPRADKRLLSNEKSAGLDVNSGSDWWDGRGDGSNSDSSIVSDGSSSSSSSGGGGNSGGGSSCSSSGGSGGGGGCGANNSAIKIGGSATMGVGEGGCGEGGGGGEQKGSVGESRGDGRGGGASTGRKRGSGATRRRAARRVSAAVAAAREGVRVIASFLQQLTPAPIPFRSPLSLASCCIVSYRIFSVPQRLFTRRASCFFLYRVASCIYRVYRVASCVYRVSSCLFYTLSTRVSPHRHVFVKPLPAIISKRYRRVRCRQHAPAAAPAARKETAAASTKG